MLLLQIVAKLNSYFYYRYHNFKKRATKERKIHKILAQLIFGLVASIRNGIKQERPCLSFHRSGEFEI
jgi:hypothetical protein